MSAFGSLVTEASAVMFEVYGDTVTYRVASSGATSSIQAILIDQTDTGETALRKYILLKSDVTALRMDQITHGSDVYTIYGLADENDGMWTVDCAIAQTKG